MKNNIQLETKIKHLIETDPKLKDMDLKQAIYFLKIWDSLNQDKQESSN